MRDVRFSAEINSTNTDAVANLLLQPRLWIPSGDYPAHIEWRDKAISDLVAENKRAITAFWGSESVGTIVYQRHCAESHKLEIKNISVEKHARGRHIAPFLLRWAELEGQHDFPGVTEVIGDTKLTNNAMTRFLSSQQYVMSAPEILMGSFAHNGNPDIVFSKNLRTQ